MQYKFWKENEYTISHSICSKTIDVQTVYIIARVSEIEKCSVSVLINILEAGGKAVTYELKNVRLHDVDLTRKHVVGTGRAGNQAP